MNKKPMRGLFALLVVFSMVVLISSCAKKQVGLTETVAVEPEEEARAEEAAEKPAMEGEDYEAKEAERQAKLRELERKQKIAAFENTHIYFDFDKSDLKPEAKAVLRDKADFLKENPSLSITIEGHCDERGTNEYNLALGERRAHSAQRYLMALGVSESRMSTVSYGEERPADPGHNEEAWAKNRRCEFKIHG